VGKHPGGKAFAGTFSDAAAFGEIVFNCTRGSESLNVLKGVGEKNLNGKVLVDISNPLDFSHGMPPTLTVSNTSSMAEEIQKAFPAVKVVKTLNTMNCNIMVNPAALNGGDHNVFINGNDDEAKKRVAGILKSFGWIEKNIADLGDIKASRGTEMYLPLWLYIMGSRNTGAFNIKIISL
jgi:predicted dinucleotide-binding enzyme